LIPHCLKASVQAGHSINLDNNDGDPIGVSVAQFNVSKGVRVTSSTAFLSRSSRALIPNLKVLTGTMCTKILFEGKKACGVEVLPTIKLPASGKPKNSSPTVIRVKQEVILTSGCFQSPQLLLLSGIGPSAHLSEMSIPLIADLPVGQNLQDHSALACEFIVSPSISGHNQLLNDHAALAAATAEYASSKTGPLAVFGASAAIIFPRLQGVSESQEFSRLPEATKEFLKKPGRPSTELWMHSGPLFYTGPCPTDASVLVIEGLCQNNLSRGNLQLASRDPRAFPKIDPGYLSHEYDVRIAVETVREILKLADTEAFRGIIESILLAPRSQNDKTRLAKFDGIDDKVIEEFVRDTLTQGFHSMSTCVMGGKGDGKRVVDKDFRVVGIKGLRVADMSVCPILTSNHTQVNAYLIGEKCVAEILGDYGKDQ
jgi:choline dehydrogenase-like flavoprotein